MLYLRCKRPQALERVTAQYLCIPCSWHSWQLTYQLIEDPSALLHMAVLHVKLRSNAGFHLQVLELLPYLHLKITSLPYQETLVCKQLNVQGQVIESHQVWTNNRPQPYSRLPRGRRCTWGLLLRHAFPLKTVSFSLQASLAVSPSPFPVLPVALLFHQHAGVLGNSSVTEPDHWHTDLGVVRFCSTLCAISITLKTWRHFIHQISF